MIPQLTEAERQALIALIELAEPIETPNNTHYTFYPNSLEEAAAYFHNRRVDWSPAYASLVNRGLIQPRDGHYDLTEAGAALARQERLDHPPIWYWYREYYRLTAHSPAYSRFCAALYGRDLCQTNFSDMQQIDSLIQAAHLRPGDRALDLGCGRGLFAEYLADCTGARVWGVDYIPEAIEQALERTAPRRDQLNFRLGNFDHLDQLDLPKGSFDLLTSIDTFYMPNDLPATLNMLRDLLAPGGRMLVYYMNMLFDPNLSRDALSPDGTDLGIALRKIGLAYRTWDFSAPTQALMQRKHRLAEQMRAEFEAEGALFLYNHLVAESDSSTQPYDPATAHLARYLYEIAADEALINVANPRH